MKHFIVVILFFLCSFFIQQSYAAISMSFELHGIPEGPAYKNVEAVLKNLKKKTDKQKKLSDPTKVEQDTSALIRKALQPYGYFDAKVATQITEENEQPHVTVTIKPGPAIMVRKVDIVITGEAKNDTAFKQLIRKEAPHNNTQLNTEAYDSLKTHIYNTAAERGYFDARMNKSQITINKPSLSATIIIHFDSGARYRFGAITLEKNPYNPNFIKKYLLIEPKQYYNATHIQQSKKNLLNTNNFTNVTIRTYKKDTNNKTVDTLITPEAKKPRQYIFGAGYGTDTGMRGTLGLNYRRINSWGHRLETMLQASQVNSSFTTSYKIPGSNPLTQEYVASAGIGHIDQNTGTSDARKITFSQITTKDKWHRIMAINALDENYDITDLPKTDTRMIYPSINWVNRNADDILNPKNGYSTSINMAGTADFLSSQHTGFFQVRVDSDYLKSMNQNTTRLLLRNSVGRTIISSLSQLPLSLQLFAGGSRSIRGYSYNSIGPGRNLLTGTVELQQAFPHSQSWYLAGFYDAGNVSDDDIFTDIKESAGPGIVWLSPLGMMELDLAFPVFSSDHDMKIQFSMGPAL